MPDYTFRRRSTGEEWTDFISISERRELLDSDPDIEQLVTGAPLIGDPIRLGRIKPDDGFRERLGEIKKAHPGSTMNVM